MDQLGFLNRCLVLSNARRRAASDRWLARQEARRLAAADKLLARQQAHETLHNAAHRAGMAAGNAAQPDPMTVVDSANGTAWTVPDGLCGFAWVKVSARGSFARWALDCGLMRKSSVQPGAFLRVHEFGQSMIRKEAYAKAYAEHLGRAGIDATYGSRLD